MYEHHTERLLPRRQFFARLARHGGIAFALLCFSLLIGMWGFHRFVGEAWIDSFLNAAMLLGGMGPVGVFDRPAGKIFAGFYALYAGLVFLGAGSFVLAPIIHRMLHSLHLEEESERSRVDAR